MQIISKIKFIPRYLPPIKYFIPKNLKEIHNKLPSRRISRYKRDINTDRRHENWSTRSHAKRRWFPVLSSDLNASRWKNGHSLSRLCARFMGRPIFAFNPKSPPIDRRRWKRWPLLEYDATHTVYSRCIHTYGTKYLRANGWTHRWPARLKVFYTAWRYL